MLAYQIAITFARMNPPTIGHELLARRLKDLVSAGFVLESRIYLSASHDDNKNPLSFEDRYRYVKHAFQDLGLIVSDIPQKDWMNTLSFVSRLGFNSVLAVVGSDRYPELKKRVPMYNGSLYNFSSLDVMSVGNRDDSDTVAGMSASRLRAYARSDDLTSFERGLPDKLRTNSREIFEKVRACHTRALVNS